jgi:hypothetical protein
MKKKLYIKPEVEMIFLDNTISLQMLSTEPPEVPGPRPPTGNQSPASEPFASPFGDKPFN